MQKMVGLFIGAVVAVGAIGLWVKSAGHATSTTVDTTARIFPHEIMKANDKELPVLAIEGLN